MSAAPTETSALVVRWLCHDLATPVATLLTASELLGDTGDDEINGLISQAIRRLSARLRLVRLALGTGGATMATAQLQKLLAESLPETPLTLALPDGDGPPASLVAGAALLLAELHRPSPLVLDGEGARWSNDHELPETAVAALNGTPGEDARSAMIGLVVAQALASGWRLVPQASGLGFAQA